jgi:hypothetical protein
MALQRRTVLIILWLVSMVAAGAWGYAQAVLPSGQAPVVLSGSDLGFRVEGRRGNTPSGRFVVRINGQWVEVEQSVGTMRLTAR